MWPSGVAYHESSVIVCYINTVKRKSFKTYTYLKIPKLMLPGNLKWQKGIEMTQS